MSRVGKQVLTIPQKTEVSISGGTLTVKGPHGELKKNFKPEVNIAIEGDKVSFEPKSESLEAKALWGTYAAHVANMIEGVNKPFVKELVVEGVGYRSEMSGDTLVLGVGFSHPVKVKVPLSLKVTAEKNVITIAGPDKEVVGTFAAEVRAKKPPEPYKGKGIRYKSEVVRRKEGKKTA